MPRFSRFALVASGLLLTTAVTAQRRSVADVVLVPEAQVELALKGDDYVLVTLNSVARSGGDNTLGGAQLRLGFEHFWNAQWSAGLALRVLTSQAQSYGDIAGLVGNITPGVLLRHRSKIGSLNVGQRLGVEYATTFDILDSNIKSRALARLRLDAEQTFPLGPKLALRPRLAYEAVVYLRLQRDEDEFEERVVDFGSLRGEVGVRLSPQFDFTPYVAWQTGYYNFLSQYGPGGNQTSGGRTNLVTPVIGLDLRFTLLPKQGVGNERQQLPTQH